MSDAIVRILPLSALYRSIIRGQSRMDGRMPDRVVASRLQIMKWISDCGMTWAALADIRDFAILGIPVVEGAHDAQPELIWSYPVTGE